VASDSDSHNVDANFNVRAFVRAGALLLAFMVLPPFENASLTRRVRRHCRLRDATLLRETRYFTVT
jgi:hypothetical protein